jgi:hypothetical protein
MKIETNGHLIVLSVPILAHRVLISVFAVIGAVLACGGVYLLYQAFHEPQLLSDKLIGGSWG